MLGIVFIGAVWIYVLGLAPVFTVCFRRRRWGAIAAGFFTFGLAWWAAALRGRPRKDLENLSVALACAVLGVGVFAARPVQFFGFDAATLGNSVGNAPFFGRPCQKLPGGEWICRHQQSYDTGFGTYRVVVDSLGCWHGILVGESRLPPEHISGCVHLQNYLF